MAYLHCHNCNWEQDDFWEEGGYNPFRPDLIEYLKGMLFRDKVGWQDHQTGVVRDLERKARNIRNMKVKTWEDWEKVKDTWRCPECGSDRWGID